MAGIDQVEHRSHPGCCRYRRRDQDGDGDAPRRAPKTLHADEPSANVDWSEGEVELLREARPWEVGNGRPRRAGVSSFGVSGTNAHVILEGAPPSSPEEIRGTGKSQGAMVGRASVVGSGVSPSVVGAGLLPFVVSGSCEDALRAQASRLAARLREKPELDLGDVANTLALHRSRLSHRATIVCSDRDVLTAGLEALSAGKSVEGLVRGVAGNDAKTAYLFSGQGSQWSGMGLGLYEAFPVFAEAFDSVCVGFDGRLGCSLREVVLLLRGRMRLCCSVGRGSLSRRCLRWRSRSFV